MSTLILQQKLVLFIYAAILHKCDLITEGIFDSVLSSKKCAESLFISD